MRSRSARSDSSIGAVLADRIGGRFGVGPTIVGLGVRLRCRDPADLAIAPADLAFAFIAASVFIGGFGNPLYNINQVSLRQAITPQSMQGRMNATMRFIVWGTIPIGAIVGGFLGGIIGLHQTLWVAAIGGLVAFMPVTRPSDGHIVTMPEPVDEETAPTEIAASARRVAASGRYPSSIGMCTPRSRATSARARSRRRRGGRRPCPGRS